MFQLVDTFVEIDEILQDIEFISKNKKIKISNVPAVFDIEASSFYENNEKRCCMYAWVFGINGKCIRGRTWKQFINLTKILINYYELSNKKRLIIYVHNLSYEFQWFKHLFEWSNVFSVEDRKPVYAITKDGIEFRCSYLLSGLSLAVVGENLLKYKVKKMVGDLDYQLIRHTKTPLNEKEWGYILNDGLVVMAYIQELIEQYEGLNKIPYTKTGFVRLFCINNCLKGDDKFSYSNYIKKLTLEEADYKQLKRTFTGGFTHANHNMVGLRISNVHSMDFTSSYPTVMLAEKFPMSKPIYWALKSKEDFLEKLNKYCCMFDITFYNITSKIDYEHYISKARCNVAENYVLDNGRIIEASKIQISITEQDFWIITKNYQWEKIEVGNFRYYYKDYLPKELILSILQLYKDKTELKGVSGQEANYMAAKGNINSVYGASVTDPCKDEIIYDNDTGWGKELGDLNKLIEAYNKSNRRFLYYPWGIWITAYARKNLWTGILELQNDYIYSDTDSLKFINYEKHKEYFNNYNIKIIEKLEKCLKNYNIPLYSIKPKTIKNIEKPLGIWDYEGNYKYFKTLGAKRYMYVDDEDNLHITISGVSKKKGIKYLKYKYKTNLNIIKNFDDNLIFPAEYYDENGEKDSATGKLTHTYIDDAFEGYITDYLGNEEYYKEASGVHMEPSDYNLSLDDAFKNYIMFNSISYII